MGLMLLSAPSDSRIVRRNVIVRSALRRPLLGVCLLVSFLQSGFFALALVPDPHLCRSQPSDRATQVSNQRDGQPVSLHLPLHLAGEILQPGGLSEKQPRGRVRAVLSRQPQNAEISTGQR